MHTHPWMIEEIQPRRVFLRECVARSQIKGSGCAVRPCAGRTPTLQADKPDMEYMLSV
eukprot:m.117316 g.117316  ORF g.117316 m.117316 type:complete len:58 (-) comp21688_c0_seq2:123-296(-)